MDIFTAIVPAEVLAAQAFVTTQCVATTINPDGSQTTGIVHPDLLKYSFFALLVVSIALYLIGHGLADLGWADVARMLIPPVAFIGWTALQTNTALNVLMPKYAGGPAIVAVTIAAIVLAPLANKLGVAADHQAVPADAK